MGAIAGTLPDCRYSGQMKLVRMETDGGDYSLTVTSHSTGTPTFVFNDADDSMLFMWDGDVWVTISSNGI